ncbi:MAG: hypothetical protein JXA20_18325 [Spirochaetes bacterium]|nr:hypothetical protein [Spirochaetota bacterium]
MIRYSAIAPFIALTAAVLIHLSCSGTTGNTATGPVKEGPIDLVYQQEGFVSRDTFRVVIVAERNVGDADLATIRDNARKRSLTTLQKYLQSSNRNVTQNTTAQLLNLIEEKGNLVRKDDITEKNTVFFFDVEKRDIRRYLDSISRR